jgi:starch phosphorylase
MKVPTNFTPALPSRIAGLGELAENLWWSWHPAARMLFKMLHRRRWKESIHNPDKMLKEMPEEILQAASCNDEFLAHYDAVLNQFHQYIGDKTCSLLQSDCPHDTPVIAYFSAEYGLHHSLPFYAGGLGFLAGDYIKECSDLKIPLVAVGFMYPEGYVSQRVSADGWQENVHFQLDREAASISRVIDSKGLPLIIQVPIIEPPIFVAVWQVNVGRVPLYLLDTDIEENEPWDRGISSRLYAGDLEQRLRQEIVLGIGGDEMLQVLGIEHSVVHLNEGHAAFSLLERIRDRIVQGLSFEEAIQKVRDTTVFTTHTPVPAGNDVFPFPMIEKYFSRFLDSLGLDREIFLQLGTHPEKPHGFNMTAFALRLSDQRNGVSRKHGEVANQMWQSLWPDKLATDRPIDSITNGVHVPTWIEPKMELLLNKHLPNKWLNCHDDLALWTKVDSIPDEELWKTHVWLKIKLFEVIRERARQRWSLDKVNPSMVIAGGAMLDPSVLTIGFARRFATYKRADLIFFDMERLKKMLKNRWQPLQIIFAGKAHPDDHPGKMILQKIVNIAKDPEFAGRIAFVEDYSEQFAQYLVHGVDVWLNNPIPPMEASGTSGMKASLNGVPNLSILDGWWLEGFSGDNGWAFGDDALPGDRSMADASAIDQIIEEKIIPLYYDTSDEGIPVGWVKIMKNAIKQTGSNFSARRMVKEYVRKFYTEALSKA